MGLEWTIRLLAVLSFAALIAAPAAAQVDEDEPGENSGEDMEELVVVGERPGDELESNARYREMLRQQMIDEVQRSRLEEEQAWRRSGLPLRSEPESRIVWGYDPKMDLEMRRELDIDSLPGDGDKPATLFRARF